MIVPNPPILFTIFDFFLIAILDISFFWLFWEKHSLKQVWPIVSIISLLRAGILSLVCSWFIVPYYSIYSSSLELQFLILFLVGVVIGTFIYQRELMVTREKASALALKLSIISSITWITFRKIITYTQFTLLIEYHNIKSTNHYQDISIFSLIWIFTIGIMVVYYYFIHEKTTRKESTTVNGNYK